jgi:hypothetical protein
MPYRDPFRVRGRLRGFQVPVAETVRLKSRVARQKNVVTESAPETGDRLMAGHYFFGGLSVPVRLVDTVPPLPP